MELILISKDGITEVFKACDKWDNDRIEAENLNFETPDYKEIHKVVFMVDEAQPRPGHTLPTTGHEGAHHRHARLRKTRPCP